MDKMKEIRMVRNLTLSFFVSIIIAAIVLTSCGNMGDEYHAGGDIYTYDNDTTGGSGDNAGIDNSDNSDNSTDNSDNSHDNPIDNSTSSNTGV